MRWEKATDMKAKILQHLSQSATILSGQRLSAVLGVSRVAVWKHIRQLQELGYDIEATPKGYRLLAEPDTPFPWVFGDRADRLHYYPELASTMDEALALARSGCPEFTVVVADRQTKGRGRLQRSWHSVQGGLYFTMVLRPKIPTADSALINLAAGVDIAETVRDLYGIQAQLKWPNDLLVDGRKLCGILSQMAADPDRIEYVNLGVGVNVHNDTRQVSPPAVSVAAVAGRTVSRADILAGFWDRFERRLARGGLSDVVAQWKEKAVTLGRQVRVQTLNDVCEGQAVDIEENGALVLETAGGARKTIVYGDCFHQGGTP
jgi:BirA family biotin operon repressor/biotin-[acetyl-CoA-carboxylase] ligase